MTSHRQIFRSSAITGGASAITIIIGIIKVKVLATVLGPAGVGLMGLYQNTMSVASTLASCGLVSSGVRQVAAAAGEASVLATVRRALWLSNILLGLIGMITIWALREPIAIWVFGDTAYGVEVGWLGLGVLLTLIAGSQMALLQGLRRTGDLARVSVISAFAGSAVGILLVFWLKIDGVVWFVLAAPLVSILVSTYYAARLPRPESACRWLPIGQQWMVLLKLGVPLMAAGLLTLVSQLATRSIILRELGLDASGNFQAAWTISMNYIGFVLGAMGVDYFPRLTAVVGDDSQASRLVNEQTEMALLLAGPVLLAMLSFAPWVIHLLYSASFSQAIEVLRWQVLGDILKVASWPMGFILVAKGRGAMFVGTELIWSAAYLGVVSMCIHEWGIVMAGIGFWFAYVVLYGVIAVAAWRLIGFRPAQRNVVNLFLLLLSGGLIMILSKVEPTLGYVVGTLLVGAACLYSLHRLNRLIDMREWIRQKRGR